VFSKILRRTHMYLALFLSPWMLMYALSTLAMNHRRLFQDRQGGNPVVFEREKDQTYSGTFAPGATPRQMGLQILSDLGLEGAYNANTAQGGSRLTIVRQSPVAPRRITFTKADGKLVIEKQVFRANSFLERMHRRRGFQHDYALEDAWAVSVDLVICALVFWVASGLWMWWEMKGTRRWGALSAAAGLGLFGFFLASI